MLIACSDIGGDKTTGSRRLTANDEDIVVAVADDAPVVAAADLSIADGLRPSR